MVETIFLGSGNDSFCLCYLLDFSSAIKRTPYGVTKIYGRWHHTVCLLSNTCRGFSLFLYLFFSKSFILNTSVNWRVLWSMYISFSVGVLCCHSISIAYNKTDQDTKRLLFVWFITLQNRICIYTPNSSSGLNIRRIQWYKCTVYRYNKPIFSKGMHDLWHAWQNFLHQ